MRVEREGTDILIGQWPPHPEQTALVEARGALLAWDVLAGDAVPAARVDDAERAADWLWEIYGVGTAAEILKGANEVTVSADGDWRVRDACRTVAQLGWVDAWWPASAVAGVPPVSRALLRGELAITIDTIEHLLDDDESLERALVAAGQLTSIPEVDGTLAVLAENHGVALSAAPTQVEFALAAGSRDRPPGVTVLSGADAVDWALVPSGVVDAAADAEWAVVRSGGATHVEVAVSLVPGARPRLAARFGQVEVDLDRLDDFGRLTGRAPVPATVLLLPPAHRVLTVYAPDFAQPEESSAEGRERRAAIIAYARSRTESPSATLTERMAGRR
jgi:hypothetical protein